MLKKYLASLLFSFTLLFTLAANADTAANLLRTNNDPVAGNPKGKITIVEFFDYQCSHCVSMSRVIQDIIKQNPSVRVVFKDFPIRGPLSDYAARAALAANKQGKYYEFNHALFSTSFSLNEDTITEIAKNVGLSIPQFKKDLNSDAINKQISNNDKLARELNINGTPALFIGKTDAKNTADLNFVMGEMSQSELQEAIDNAAK